jgi:hypothetical protein
MKRGTRLARALAPAFLAALGLALAAFPAFAEDEASRLTGVVNVNTATVEELQLLPGIGEARAHAAPGEGHRRGGARPPAPPHHGHGQDDRPSAVTRRAGGRGPPAPSSPA